MKAVPKFRDAVMAIAAKHGIELDRTGVYLRLKHEACGNLVIENIGGERISVTNYIQVGDDWMADPEIVVYVSPQSAGHENETDTSIWYPIEINQFFGGWQLCGELGPRGDLVVYDLDQQAELAILADKTVASMLVTQDWLNAGSSAADAIRARTLDEIHARDIRVEEMEDVPF